MVRMNINVVRINELKWMRMGEFNSEDYYIYYYGQECLRRNGVALKVNKSLKCSTWVQSQKWQNDLGSFPKQTIQHHSNPSLCLNYWCWRSWNWWVLWRSITPYRTNTHTHDVLFIIGDWKAKVKSRDTWNNREVSPWNIPGQRLTFLSREHTSHSKNPFPTTQEKTLQWTWPIVNTEIRLIMFFLHI